MPITDSYARLPLETIYVNREKRQRKELSTAGLKESIKARGVFNPIIVERHGGPDGLHRLIAGERRYRASQELQLPDIPIRFADELDPLEAQIFELEENIKRQDLSWQDLVLAVQSIHGLYQNLKPDWTQFETSEAIGISKGSVSNYIRVAAFLHDEQISNCSSIREAYNILVRREERVNSAELDAFLQPVAEATPAPAVVTEPPAPAEVAAKDSGLGVLIKATTLKTQINPARNILLESFVHWAPKYSGPLFNLIHCDFPYGINVFDGPQAGGQRHHEYDDSREVHFKLLETLLVNLDRLASSSCHIVYWFSMQHYRRILDMVNELSPTLYVHNHPLVWVKSDNSGIAADPRRFPRHVYETALLMIRGRRQIVKIVNDAYSAPTDSTWHIHTKPEPMLRYFFGMLVDENTVFLDPTCGSGSSLRAAESLGASAVLGMDIDEEIVGRARLALREFRAKKSVSMSNAALF